MIAEGRSRAAFGVLVTTGALAIACGKGSASGTAAGASSSSVATSHVVPAAAEANAIDAATLARDPEVDVLWREAKDGDADELARLARREGSTGLEERGDVAEYRATAIRALAYADGFSAFPWLVSAANAGNDAERTAAMETIVTWSARPRRAVDPEDALEVREGCDALVTFAKDDAHPRGDRVLAVRALRMLADRGCKGDDPAFAALETK